MTCSEPSARQIQKTGERKSRTTGEIHAWTSGTTMSGYGGYSGASDPFSTRNVALRKGQAATTGFVTGTVAGTCLTSATPPLARPRDARATAVNRFHRSAHPWTDMRRFVSLAGAFVHAASQQFRNVGRQNLGAGLFLGVVFAVGSAIRTQ